MPSNLLLLGYGILEFFWFHPPRDASWWKCFRMLWDGLGCLAVGHCLVQLLRIPKFSCHQIRYCLDMGFLSFWSLLGNWVCNSLAQFTMEILKVNHVHSTFHAIPPFYLPYFLVNGGGNLCKIWVLVALIIVLLYRNILSYWWFYHTFVAF
jgi:hypothetical protein